MLEKGNNSWNVTVMFLFLVMPSNGFIEILPKPSGEVKSNGDTVTDVSHLLPELNLEDNTVTDVKVNIGDLAYLPCRFANLGQVSWIRRSDWHILTTGTYSYTTDVRFNLLHREGSEDWTLQLKYVQGRDNGTYECQMYTATGVLSQYVNLHVIKPKASIQGPSELHMEEGETFTLVCLIQQTKPPFVFWYHGENMVNYEGDRDRVQVTTEVEEGKTRSTLTINQATFADSGNYSCIPPNVESASVMVHIMRGDDPEPVQRWEASTSNSAKISLLNIPLLFFIIFLIILSAESLQWR